MRTALTMVVIVFLVLTITNLLSGKGRRVIVRKGGSWGVNKVTFTHLTGEAVVRVQIRAYNATGELNRRSDPFTLGTRVLLICDVTGLPEGNVVVSYRWYHKCTGTPHRRCEIRDGDPYYRVVCDTLLVDITSQDQGGRYSCAVHYLQKTERAITRELSVAG